MPIYHGVRDIASAAGSCSMAVPAPGSPPIARLKSRMDLRAVLSFVAMLSPVAAAGADVAVDVKRESGAFSVEASAELEADVPTAWEVLTDYDHLADFIPDMRSSRVLSRDGSRAEVEQKGEARLLFIAYPIDVLLAVTEYPPYRIVSRAVAGNFREMRGEYRLEPGPRSGRVLLRYTGRMMPEFEVPPLLGALLLRRHVGRTFGALAREIERRHAGRALPLPLPQAPSPHRP